MMPAIDRLILSHRCATGLSMTTFLARWDRLGKWVACLLGLWAGLGSVSLLACKYSVRDVAFVDLSRETFDFLTLVPSSQMDAVKARLRPVANAVLLDSNVRLSWLAAENASSHPAFSTAEHPLESPAFCLYREGYAPLFLNLPKPLSTMEDAEWWAWLENLVQSPTRRVMEEQLLEAYAVVLVVEGSDARENQRVRLAADSAAASIAKLIPGMPKPVDVPPQVVVVGSDRIRQESPLLWSLGLNWKSPDVPQAAVVLGRGRRLGPVLKADEVTSTRLQEILAVAGQDCECDLDRSWMQGPMIPVRWGPDREQAAYKALGFDPENPLVKAEISRILARGKNPVTGEENDTIGTELDMLLLGYSEEVLELGTEEIPDISHHDAHIHAETPGAPEEMPGVRAIERSASTPEGEESVEAIRSDSETVATSATASTPVQAQTHPGILRRSLVMLAGFCVFALLGGIGVLMFGRRRG